MKEILHKVSSITVILNVGEFVYEWRMDKQLL